MQNIFSIFSPGVAFGLGMMVQGLYKLVPTLDTRGWKKLLGIFVFAFLMILVGLLDVKNGDLGVEDFFIRFCVYVCVFLFFSFRRQILPKINELVLLCWNLGVWYILLKNFGINHPFTLVLLVPTVFSFSVVFLNVQLNKFFQIGLYLWFMIMSCIVTFTYFPWQSVRTGFQTHHFSSSEMFFLGMAMFYAFAYFLCLLAFIPLPDKHAKRKKSFKSYKEHLADVQARYDDVQFHPAISFLVTAIVVAALGINYVSHFTSEVVLLGILFGVSPILGEKLHWLLSSKK